MPCTSPPLTLHFTDVGSPGRRLQGIILDISSNRLFKAVRVGEPTETRNRPFLNVKFANKGIDALNVSNILNQKSVKIKSLRTFDTRSRHAFPIAIPVLLLPKLSITKQVCSNSTFKLFPRMPPCNCSESQFLYSPCGQIVTGDLNIVRYIKLRDLFSKGPKYREPVLYSWPQNFGIIMDACEEYARGWTKKEDVEADTLSEWIKSIADVLKHRIRRIKHSVNTIH